jgi:hypothetical protein
MRPASRPAGAKQREKWGPLEDSFALFRAFSLTAKPTAIPSIPSRRKLNVVCASAAHARTCTRIRTRIHLRSGAFRKHTCRARSPAPGDAPPA